MSLRVATIIVAAAALVTSIVAVATSIAALHAAYRPVLRPVPLMGGTPFNSSMYLLLKNIGRGPAIGVVVFKAAAPDVVMGHVDVVEPLGAALGGGEETRVGRRRIDLNPFFEHGALYRVVCQDLAGRWHETRFAFHEKGFTDVKLFGPEPFWRRDLDIPDSARRRSLRVDTFLDR